jgi:hypothetical protein
VLYYAASLQLKNVKKCKAHAENRITVIKFNIKFEDDVLVNNMGLSSILRMVIEFDEREIVNLVSIIFTTFNNKKNYLPHFIIKTFFSF